MSEHKILEGLERSLRACGIRRVSRAQLELLVLTFGAIQGITLLIYLATYETATLHVPAGAESREVSMTAGRWLVSRSGRVLVTVVECADWMATLVLLSVGLLGLIRQAGRPSLALVLAGLADIVVSNVPWAEIYRHGLWTIEETPATLTVEYTSFFRREHITIADLDRLDTICVEPGPSFLWRKTTRAELRYRDGRSGRLSVGGFRFGNIRPALDGLDREFRSALARVADRAGAVYRDQPAGCGPPPVADSKEGAYVDPFHGALVAWIGFLFVMSRVRWTQRWRADEARGGLGPFFSLEAMMGGVLRVFVFLVPAYVLAFGLHRLVGAAHVPAPPGATDLHATALQLALLFSLVDVLSTLRATEGPVPTDDEYPTAFPAFYYFNLAMAWVLGWAGIAIGKARSPGFGPSLHFFRPPDLWRNWMQDAATFGFLLAMSIPICAFLAAWRGERLAWRRPGAGSRRR